MGRACHMKREAATVLWMGFLHAHFSDDALREDVHKFLQAHAAQYLHGAKIQIVNGHYKKAHTSLLLRPSSASNRARPLHLRAHRPRWSQSCRDSGQVHGLSTISHWLPHDRWYQSHQERNTVEVP